MTAPLTFVSVVYNNPNIYYIGETDQKKKKNKLKSDFQCYICGITETMQPRRGPLGKNTLCNRCGIRWKKEQDNLKKMKLEYILNE